MNPQTGRFMGMDTFEGDQEDPLSLHKYAFVKGDGGVNGIDPSGNDGVSDVGPSKYDAMLFAYVHASQMSSIQVTAQTSKGPNIIMSISHERPQNAATYFTDDGTPFLAPEGTDFQGVFEAGKLNGMSNVGGINAAVGHFGTYDFQRQPLGGGLYTFYYAYQNASNFAVGDFMHGAGYNLSWTIRIASTFSVLGMSPKGTVAKDTPWWTYGWNFAK